MADNKEITDLPIELQGMPKTFKQLNKYFAQVLDEEEEKALRKFVKISKVLSSFLPEISDPTLTEIDDLLYPDVSMTTNTTTKYSKESISFIVKSFLKPYLRFYDDVSCFCSKNAIVRNERLILDKLFLQLISNSSKEMFEFEDSYSLIYSVIGKLVKSRCCTELCLAMKILLILAPEHKKDICKEINTDFHSYYTILWISNVVDIPQAKTAQKKRITTWLSQQSRSINNHIDVKSLKWSKLMPYELKDFCDLNEKIFCKEYITKWHNIHLNYSWMMPKYMILYDFFMSATNEEQKTQRIKSLLRRNDKNRKGETGDVVRSICYTLGRHLEMLNSIYVKGNYSDELLRDMEQQFGYDTKPYLEPVNNCPSDIESERLNKITSYLKYIDDENKSLSITKIDDSIPDDEPDYTIEKYLIYDDFVKSLHVISILYTACMMSKTILETNGDIEGHDSYIFGKNYFRTIALDQLLFKSKWDKIPWIFELLLKKCPFLFLSNRQEYLWDDLLKMMKGEEIDTVAKENLFFALTSITLK